MKLSPAPLIRSNVAILTYAQEGLTFMFTFPDEVPLGSDLNDLKLNSLSKVQIRKSQDYRSSESDIIVKIG